MLTDMAYEYAKTKAELGTRQLSAHSVRQNAHWAGAHKHSEAKVHSDCSK